MKVTFFILLIFIILQTSFADIVAPQINSCEFYLSLEQSTACGPSGYTKDFGYPYCEKFLKSKFYRFSREGKIFLLKNALCLQNILYAAYNENQDISCNEIKALSFEGHNDCYIDSGFCELPISDKIILTNIIKNQLASKVIRAQIREALKRCYK